MSRAAPVIQAAWEAVFAGLSGAAAFVVKQHQGGAYGPQHRALADLGGRPSSSRAPTPSTNDYGSAEAWNPPVRLASRNTSTGSAQGLHGDVLRVAVSSGSFREEREGPDVP
jgi:hypothetical protein